MSTARADRARGAWRGLSPEQRLAVVASLLLLLSMLLPWYQVTTSFAVDGDGRSDTDGRNAFQVYSFIEAAIFLVVIGVIVLMFARGQRRAFHLPGGDGTVVMAAGIWVMFLIFFRTLDKPDVTGSGAVSVSVGVGWGIFIAFLLGALLAYAGFRIRAAHVPEPDLEAARPPAPAEPPTRPTTPMRPARRSPAGTSEAPTTVEGQLSFDEAPGEAPTERAEPAAPRAPREPPEDGDVPEYHPPPRRRHPG